MHFTKREQLIIKKLIATDYQFDQLQADLNISSRTLKNDINKINQGIASFDSIIKLNNNYMHFESIYPKTHWYNLLKINNSISDEHLIFLKLLLSDQLITKHDLAQAIYVSTTKLENIIASSTLISNNLTATRNKGLSINKPRTDKVILAITTLLPYVDDLNYLVTSRLLVAQIIDQVIPIDQFIKTKTAYEQAILEFSALSDLENKSLFILFLIKEFVYPLSCEEQSSLLARLVSLESYDEKNEALIKIVIAQVFDRYNIRIQNEALLQDLLNHIKTVLSRLIKNDTPVYISTKIIQDYPYALNIATELNNSLSLKLQQNIDANENYLIAIYIQSFLNLQQKQHFKIKILIVCQYGLSVSNYLYHRLKQDISEELDIKICSIYKFWQLQEQVKQFDLVITTIENLEANGPKVFKISDLLNDNELLALKNQLDNYITHQQLNLLIDNINVKNAEINSIDEIYHDITQDLLNYNPVFLEKMKTRTAEGLVNINGVIILHSDSNYNYTNQILVYKLKDAVKYQNQDVQMIFVYAFTSDFIAKNGQIIKNIYRIINTKVYVDTLYATKTDKQFLWMFKSQLQGGKNVK